ncbi:metallophosphatase, partial [bacterium]|nr:metallophosphatase [bacterium]
MRKSKNILLLSLLIFIFLLHLYAADIQCIWTGIEKIVAVGDLHGDFDNFKTILEGTGLIDRKLHWTGGKTHLVQ